MEPNVRVRAAQSFMPWEHTAAPHVGRQTPAAASSGRTQTSRAIDKLSIAAIWHVACCFAYALRFLLAIAVNGMAQDAHGCG